MKSRAIILVITCALLGGRVKIDDNKNKKNLNGYWRLVERDKKLNEPPLPPHFIETIWHFGHRNAMSISRGFFKPDTGHFKNWEYLGDETTFNVGNDYLYLGFRNTENGPQRYQKGTLSGKLKFISEDSILLQKGKGDLFLVRIPSNKNGVAQFDEIVFSSSGCYGECPVMDLLIRSTGDYIEYKEMYLDTTKIQWGKNDQKLYNFLAELYKSIDVESLASSYEERVSDCHTYSVSFLKNGNLVKTVEDYCNSGPLLLQWANSRIVRSANSIKGTDLLHYYMLPMPFLNTFCFQKGDKKIILAKSESYFLWRELEGKSEKCNCRFIPICSLSVRSNFQTFSTSDDLRNERHDVWAMTSEQIRYIETDGRHYRVIYKNKPSRTFDLTYNFLERQLSNREFKFDR